MSNYLPGISLDNSNLDKRAQMNVEFFDYNLPEGYIAYHQAKRRDSSKLLVLDRTTSKVSHYKFRDIINYFNEGDGLIINDTKVLKARLRARRISGGKVEIFLLEEIKYKGEDCWRVLTHPTRRFKEGESLFLDENVSLEVVKKYPNGQSIIKFKNRVEARRLISKYGHVPLPVYIHRPDTKTDLNRYQTIFAHAKKARSVAAPTAGLHFTKGIIEKIKAKGVKIIPITLHVGYGTFKTIKVNSIEDHVVDPEYAEISLSAASAINEIKAGGGKVFAVGTTSVRTLESAEIINGEIQPYSGYVNLYIKPGFHFSVVNHLITNFHLPKSSLLVLVSAFAGRDRILDAYETAIVNKYRFYSYGDCMLIR